ncbi:Maleylacetate reductase [Comamonas testosteroni]|uniref:Maleylacetate reductase n=3 Tax=Burkholderiales TaxID=80840 RepID=A0A0L7N9P8_COMTE|nr:MULTISPECIES: maleylacetate reductase [Burkholderiales]KOC30765.1 Maleylacetate reductase [Comamonas testosteroni]KWT64731.1 Maleylacetate reductase CcdF [Comamonas testosteroni]PND29735.1 maleylacetate reductase [Achromobacter pulmonis]QTX01592.1 Maleylacetate reductase CcdF [Achromobacter sp.]
MMKDFLYQGMPSRVRFGRGTVSEVAAEVERLGCKRVLIVASVPEQAEQIRSLVGSACVGVFAGAVMHTPVEVTETALAHVHRLGADGVVALGGGSAIGLSKAIALHTDLPQLVIPTTYAGSEMTPILGQSERGVKTTQRSAKVLPETVIYDVDLTFSLPLTMSVSSGINAMAHAVEALYASDANPIIDTFAELGIAALFRSLPKLRDDLADPEVRVEALYGSWLSAICLASTSMGLHHKLCHTLGGALNLPHAETHAVVLPHALAYNASKIDKAMSVMKRAMGGGDPAGRIYDIAKNSGVPVGLRELGMKETDIDVVTSAVMAKPYPNPVPLDAQIIRRLIANAWGGTRPDHST